MVSALLVVFLSSCLNLDNYQPVELERYQMGSVLVNDKPYEHVVYFSQYGSMDNPFLRSNIADNMVYFPIFLSPANGDENTDVEYAVLICIDAKEGIPTLNKPYTLSRNTLLDNASNTDEIMRIFVTDRSRILVNGTEGVAVVYNYGKKTRRSANGTITFTSFDLESKSCTGYYSLISEEPVDEKLEFRNGTIATRITRESRIM